jgi:hypothetical protein
MRTDLADKSEKVVPFAPAAKGRPSNDADPLEDAGQAIVGMLERAANITKENCQHAVDVAHKLSLQLRAAEDQIKELSTDLRYYQDRAHRAERWLLRISKEIDQKFFDSGASQPRNDLIRL